MTLSAKERIYWLNGVNVRYNPHNFEEFDLELLDELSSSSIVKVKLLDVIKNFNRQPENFYKPVTWVEAYLLYETGLKALGTNVNVNKESFNRVWPDNQPIYNSVTKVRPKRFGYNSWKLLETYMTHPKTPSVENITI